MIWVKFYKIVNRKIINMEIAEQPSISTFAQIVGKIRNKNEEELK